MSGINGTEVAIVQTNSAALRKKAPATAMQGMDSLRDNIRAYVEMRDEIVKDAHTRRAEKAKIIDDAQREIADIDENLRLIGADVPRDSPALPAKVMPVRDVDDSIGGSPAKTPRRWHKHPDGTREQIAKGIVERSKGDVTARQVWNRYRAPRPTVQCVHTSLALLARRGDIQRVAKGKYKRNEAT